MARSAKLTSIDAVLEMAAALGKFGEEALTALDELDINVQRAMDWIEQDRKGFWNHEVRRGTERLSEARVELEKALTYRKMDDYTPACREERVMVDRMKRRLETAEAKNRVLPHWTQKIRHAIRELDGRQTQLDSWLRGDLPHAIAVLEQMMQTLERYAAATGGFPKKSANPKTAKPTEPEGLDEVEDSEGDETLPVEANDAKAADVEATDTETNNTETNNSEEREP